MLQTMRNLAQSWVSKGLMLVLVVSFGIWGIGDIFRGNPAQRAVATVGGESITVDDLNRAFDRGLAQMRQSLGPNLTERQAKSFGLLDKVLENLIGERQIELGVRRLGVGMNDKMVLDWMATQSEFRNPDGSFNRDLLSHMAEQSHASEADFLKQLEGTMASREMFAPFALGGKPPATITDAVARARGQKRILDVITFANESVGDIPVPDGKTLHDYYDKNPQLFTAPEYRAVTIAEYSISDAAKDASVTDDQVKKEYESHLDQYAHPERRDILQVVVENEAKAKQIADAAHASGDLAAAAGTLGLKAVPISRMEQGSILPEVGKAVFSLKTGQVSEPIKSPLGWHVIQLKKITPPGTSTFAEVKDQLHDSMQKDQAADAAAKIANELDDELASGRTLEDIADAMKLRLIKIPALDASGKTDSGKAPAELPDRDNVLRAAFEQNAGDTSPIIDDKKGDYIVVRTDQVTPSSVRPFDKVKDQVIAAWKKEEQATRATAEAEEIAKGLRAGQTPASFAARNGVDVRVSKPISLLGDSDASLPSSVMPQVAKLKKGEVMTASAPGRQYVLRLAEFANPDAVAIKADQAKVEDALQGPMMDEMMNEYRHYLGNLFPPKINNGILDTLRQQGT